MGWVLIAVTNGELETSSNRVLLECLTGTVIDLVIG